MWTPWAKREPDNDLEPVEELPTDVIAVLINRGGTSTIERAKAGFLSGRPLSNHPDLKRELLEGSLKMIVEIGEEEFQRCVREGLKGQKLTDQHVENLMKIFQELPMEELKFLKELQQEFAELLEIRPEKKIPKEAIEASKGAYIALEWAVYSIILDRYGIPDHRRDLDIFFEEFFPEFEDLAIPSLIGVRVLFPGTDGPRKKPWHEMISKPNQIFSGGNFNLSGEQKDRLAQIDRRWTDRWKITRSGLTELRELQQMYDILESLEILCQGFKNEEDRPVPHRLRGAVAAMSRARLVYTRRILMTRRDAMHLFRKEYQNSHPDKVVDELARLSSTADAFGGLVVLDGGGPGGELTVTTSGDGDLSFATRDEDDLKEEGPDEKGDEDNL